MDLGTLVPNVLNLPQEDPQKLVKLASDKGCLYSSDNIEVDFFTDRVVCLGGYPLVDFTKASTEQASVVIGGESHEAKIVRRATLFLSDQCGVAVYRNFKERCETVMVKDGFFRRATELSVPDAVVVNAKVP